MDYTREVLQMKRVACPKGHGPAELPQEGKWTQVREISDICGLSHGVGWCAPMQGCVKLTLNVKDGIIREALVESAGCSGATHACSVAAEVLPGRTLLEALNTHLACDAINRAMKELFNQLIYGRSQTAYSANGLPVGSSLDDLGKGLCSQSGCCFSTLEKGVRILEMTEGYVLEMALNGDKEVIGYKYVHLGKMMDAVRGGMSPNEAYEKFTGTSGQYDLGVEFIDPRKE